MTNMDIKELESVNGAGIDKVSGGDGTEMIPRSDKPRCPDCGSENVVVVYTMVDSKTKRRVTDYKCKRCDHIFRRTTYDKVD